MIHIQAEDSILKLTMHSPRGNMLDGDDIACLLEQTERAASAENIKGVLLTGSGSSFAAGLNLQSVGNREEDIEDFFHAFEVLLYRLFTLPKPVVAAVNGHSIGGGLLLQCCADWICISDSPKIKIGLPEVNLGLTVDGFMWSLLKHCVVSNKKLDAMLLSGEYLNTAQVLQTGFDDAVGNPESLLSQAEKQAHALVGKPAEAFAITKKCTRAFTGRRLLAALEEKSYRIFTALLLKKN